MDYIIHKSQPPGEVPYDLLLLADENPQLIETYLPISQVYLLTVDEQVCGVYLLRVGGLTGEIMNIAVAPAQQGKGLGKALLRHAIKIAGQQGLQQLLIKTGNSGIRQLALYQQQGFELIDVNYDYFTNAYPAAIWENGIQCKHQLVFALSVQQLA